MRKVRQMNCKTATGPMTIGLAVLSTFVLACAEAALPAGTDAQPDLGSPPTTDAIPARLDELVPKLMDEFHVPGVSIVGIEDRRIAWERQYGVRKAGAAEKVDRDTVFEACSMSKPPLAYLVLKLVERGEFELDRTLVEYLDKPYLKDEPLHRRITARMVLTHTSGFPNWRDGGWRKGGPLPLSRIHI